MIRNQIRVSAFLALLCCIASFSFGQSTPAAVVPPLVKFSGVLSDVDGKPMTGVIGVTFYLYKDAQGGAPVWMETQNVRPDRLGNYSAMLGSTTSAGLPTELFASGEARWLAVQPQGQAEQPRVLLISVPYALKAADAETIGGLPPSAFMRAAPSGGTVINMEATGSALPPASVTGSGTTNYVPLWTSSTALGKSAMFQSGTGSTARIGIGNTTPAATLDVTGGATIRGLLNLPNAATATATAGADSRPFGLVASTFNSTSKIAANQVFHWQAEPTGNNTATPSATLNLLFATAPAAAAETGLKINSKGVITFASGQTFPGSGTITGVTAGTALTGGGASGAVTLNVDTTKVPLLSVSNNFTGPQTITNGYLNLSPTSAPLIGSIYIGGVPFLQGIGKNNVFVGGAGNFSTTGSFTAAVGFQALFSQSSGSGNTAVGDVALYSDTTGGNNTAVGNAALFSNTSGTLNTAIGVSSGPSLGSGALTNTTAVGAGATVSQSNSLVLGQTTVSKPGTAFVNVGVGTAAPRSILELDQSATGALGPVITLTNPAGQSNAAAAIDFNTSTPAGGSGYNPNAEILAVDAGGFTDNMEFLSNRPGANNKGLQLNFEIGASGQVVVGGEQPTSTAQFVVFQNENNTAGIQAYGAGISSGELAGNGGDGILGTGGDGSSSTTEGGIGGTFAGGNNFENGFGGTGIYAQGGSGGSGNGDAGIFGGDILVTGNINNLSRDIASATGVRIDHPLDPANKYLTLSSVQSAEMLNVYSGNVTTDEFGVATVTLPDWFDAENADFRYQLTVIGGRFAQAIVSKEVANHQFSITTNATFVKVSWQVTAVRQDPYAKAHPLVVEEQKPALYRGFYRNPELYGQPEEKSVEWAGRPQMMKRMKEMRQQSKMRLSANRAANLGAAAK